MSLRIKISLIRLTITVQKRKTSQQIDQKFQSYYVNDDEKCNIHMFLSLNNCSWCYGRREEVG